MNSEIFLQKYRVLEGLLEERYDGEKTSSSSVIVEYLRDDDSQPVRSDLDLMRGIRNILSHNACDDGSAVVEPADEMIDRLESIIQYVKRPRCASEFGTPAARIYSAHPNDRIYAVMRNMRKNGYSHVPVRDRGGMIGVFSARVVFDHLAEFGLDSLNENTRISELAAEIRLDRHASGRYRFVAANASVVSVRNAFREYANQRHRPSAIFVTQNGRPEEELICMLTPWDVLSDKAPDKTQTKPQ